MSQSIQIQCPNGHLLELDLRDVGKHVKCPMCQIRMVVPAANVPAPARPNGTAQPWQRFEEGLKRGVNYREDDDEEEHQRDEVGESSETRREVRVGLRKVRAGLTYHLAKMYVLVIAFLVFFFIGFSITMGGGNIRAPGTSAVIGLLMLLVYVTSLALDVVTSINLISCPEKTEARSLAICYASVEGLSVALLVLAVVMISEGSTFVVLLGLSSLASVAGYFCMIFFLKKMARFLRKNRLADTVSGLLVLAGLAVFFYLMVMLIAAMRDPQPAGMKNPDPGANLMAGLSAIGFLITGIWGVVRYLRLLQKVRNAM